MKKVIQKKPVVKDEKIVVKQLQAKAQKSVKTKELKNSIEEITDISCMTCGTN